MSVEVKAELLASNLIVPQAWHGSIASIEPATIQYPAGGASGLASTDGLSMSLAGAAIWARREQPCDLIAITVSTALNVVVGLPWESMGYQASINGRRCEGGVLRDWEPYELVRFATRPRPGPHRVALTVEGLERIEVLIAAAMTVSGRSLWQMATLLASVERATSADHPYDRVRELWAGFESMVPGTGPLMTRAEEHVRNSVQRDRAFLGGVLTDVGPRVTFLLRQRRRLAHLPDTRRDLRHRLTLPLGTNRHRLLTAIAAAYAVRNQLYHGRWSHLADTERPIARATARLLWRLMRGEIEYRLTGRYLPTIRGTTEISAGF